ncbi:hypothetical protein BDB00DRAFT_629441 [Zychaea mexicana]|uniref:uncharacterized protein n=1 Tax=Zychaea mexicana TaxID=64656 RepID=UPI0022FF24EB|nr:uncharacterized protein BDB00DRAFT_629441 [Zychaea mexicana]KAI9489287.1 hypothetical protein BDB00DRAFT_629441 [Zychaea mexicana]
MTQPVVLVTGCTEGGIGYTLCQEFLKRDCRVYATARRIESMNALQGCEKLVLDVTDAASIESAVEKVIEDAGHIDILINNAGAPAVGALLDTDIDDARRCFEVNVFGLLAMCRAVAKHMARRGSGKIANVGSVLGYVSTPWDGIYGMSKAAVHSLSDTLRMELAPFGIQVTVVVPGAITSNFAKNATTTISVPKGMLTQKLKLKARRAKTDTIMLTTLMSVVFSIGSLYQSVVKYIYARANISQDPRCMSTAVFATYATSKLLKRYPPRYVTYGTDSSIFLLFYYLPVFIRESFISKAFGLRQVKPIANE